MYVPYRTGIDLSNKKLKKDCLLAVSGIPRVDNQEWVIFCPDEKGSAVAYLVAHDPIPAVTTRYLNHKVCRTTRLFCVTMNRHIVAVVAVKVGYFGVSDICVSHKSLVC